MEAIVGKSRYSTGRESEAGMREAHCKSVHQSEREKDHRQYNVDDRTDLRVPSVVHHFESVRYVVLLKSRARSTVLQQP